jgi:hypothetical protein
LGTAAIGVSAKAPTHEGVDQNVRIGLLGLAGP